MSPRLAVANINILSSLTQWPKQAPCPGGRLTLLAAGVAFRGRPVPAARRARHGDQAGSRGDRWGHLPAPLRGASGGCSQVLALGDRGVRPRGVRGGRGAGLARPDPAQAGGRLRHHG
jgi:hypothetical protein